MKFHRLSREVLDVYLLKRAAVHTHAQHERNSPQSILYCHWSEEIHQICQILFSSGPTGGALQGCLPKSSIIWHTAAPSLVFDNSDRVSRQCSYLDCWHNLLKLDNINLSFCFSNLYDMEPSAPKRCVLSGFNRDCKLLKRPMSAVAVQLAGANFVSVLFW